MKMLKSVVLAAFLMASTAAASKPKGDDVGNPRYVVGLPAVISESERKPVLEAVLKLALEAPGPSELVVVNATTTASIARVEIPSESGRARVRKMSGAMKSIRDAVVTPREGLPPNRIDLPRFLRHVGTLPGGAGTTTHVFVAGSLFYDIDPAAAFKPGEIPSDDHITARLSESALGTADINGALNNTFVHFATLVDEGTLAERVAAVRFWNLWLQNTRGTLASMSLEPGQAVRHVLARSTNPAFPADKLMPANSPLVIRRVSASERVYDEPVEHEVHLVLMIDGTGSMAAAMDECERRVQECVLLASSLSPRTTLSFVVYRGDAQSTLTFGPVHIDRPSAEAESRGLAEFRRWLETPVIETVELEGAHGERRGARTERRHRKPPLTPLTGFVDLERAFAVARSRLEGAPKGRVVVAVIGDAGMSEADELAGVSDADRASAARTRELVGQLARAHRDFRLVTIFCGGPGTPDSEHTIAQFKDLVEAAGQGRFMETVEGLPEVLKEQMLGK